MDSNIEAAIIGVIALAVSALLGWVWALHERNIRIEREQTKRSNDIERELTKRINEVETELLTFKLEVAEKYASIPHLQDVEKGLAKSIGKLEDLVDRLRESLPPQPQQAPSRRSRAAAEPIK